MRVLIPIPSTAVVALDIETVRLEESFENLPDLYQDAWEYKHKQDGEIPTTEQLSEFWDKRASLYAEFSKVCAVSFAFLSTSGKELMCKSFYNEDEKILLSDVENFLNRIYSSSSEYRLIGHAAHYFDYPFLIKRYLINGMKIPAILDESDKKPWDKKNMCTNDLWRPGTGPGSSLQALCVAFNVPISKADMVGDEVGREYFKGNLKDVSSYCDKDTIATFNVFRRMKGESIFQFEDVIYIDDSTKVVEDAPVLERLINTKEFTDDVKEELTDLITSRGDLTNDDFNNLVEIITAHYQAKGDKVAVKKKKREEVIEFLKSIKK